MVSVETGRGARTIRNDQFETYDSRAAESLGAGVTMNIEKNSEAIVERSGRRQLSQAMRELQCDTVIGFVLQTKQVRSLAPDAE